VSKTKITLKPSEAVLSEAVREDRSQWFTPSGYRGVGPCGCAMGRIAYASGWPMRSRIDYKNIGKAVKMIYRVWPELKLQPKDKPTRSALVRFNSWPEFGGATVLAWVDFLHHSKRWSARRIAGWLRRRGM